MMELISVIASVLTIVTVFLQRNSLTSFITKLRMKWKTPEWLREHLKSKHWTLSDLGYQCDPHIDPWCIYRWARGDDCLSIAEKEALCRALDMDCMTLELNRSWGMDEKKRQKIIEDNRKHGDDFHGRYRTIRHRADLDSYVAELAETFLKDSKSLDDVRELDDLCESMWKVDDYVRINELLTEEEMALAIQHCKEKGALPRRASIVNEQIRYAVIARMKEFPALLSPSRGVGGARELVND